MKKLVASGLVMLLAISLCACGAGRTGKSIEGLWDLTSLYDLDNNRYEDQEWVERWQYEFLPDGTVYLWDAGTLSDQGEYIVSGDRLVINGHNGTFERKGNTLKIVFPEGSWLTGTGDVDVFSKN